MKDIHETPEYQKAQKAISDFYQELNKKIDEMRASDANGDCKTMEDQYKEVKALLDDMQKEEAVMTLIDRVEVRKPVDGVGKVARDLLYQQFQSLKKSGRDIAGEIRNKYQPSYINSMQGIIKLDNVLQILARIKKCGLAKGAPLGNRNAAKDHEKKIEVVITKVPSYNSVKRVVNSIPTQLSDKELISGLATIHAYQSATAQNILPDEYHKQKGANEAWLHTNSRLAIEDYNKEIKNRNLTNFDIEVSLKNETTETR